MENGIMEAPLEVKNEQQLIHWLKNHETPLSMSDVREGRGGQDFYYLRHQYVTEKLNELCRFDWDFKILRERMDEDQVTVVGELTARIGSCTIVKTQYGSSRVERYSSGKNAGKPIAIGDEFKKGASDSLKKCASLLGLGLDLSVPVRENNFKALHATGTEVFGDKWEEARPRIIRTFSGGSKVSSKELMDAEARVLIAVMKKDKSSEIARQTAKQLRPVAAQILKAA